MPSNNTRNSVETLAAGVGDGRKLADPAPLPRAHDLVHELAVEIVDIFVNLLREDEILDAYREVYDRLQTRYPSVKTRSVSVLRPPQDHPSSQNETPIHPENEEAR